jgi:hypothetical protein
MTKKCKLEVVRLSNPWEKHYKIYKSVHPRIQYNSIPYSTLLAYPSDQTVCHRYKAIINNIQYSYVYILYSYAVRLLKILKDYMWWCNMIHTIYSPCTTLYLVSPCTWCVRDSAACSGSSMALPRSSFPHDRTQAISALQQCAALQRCAALFSKYSTLQLLLAWLPLVVAFYP